MKELFIIRKTYILAFLILIAIFTLWNLALYANDEANMILKFSVEQEHGPNIRVSFPLQALNQIVDQLLKEQEDARKKLPIDPNQLIQTLAQSDGVDLLNVKGKENVRVWVEKPIAELREEAQFIQVQITKLHHDDKRTIDLNFPVSLVQFAVSILQQTGDFDLVKILEDMQKHQPNFQQ